VVHRISFLEIRSELSNILNDSVPLKLDEYVYSYYRELNEFPPALSIKEKNCKHPSVKDSA
jgi:hypothetical protein